MFYVLLLIVGIAFFPKLATRKSVRSVLVFNAFRNWWMQRTLRDNNQGKFLTDKERKNLLSPNHNGLVLDGHRGRLSNDASFRNVAVVATTGAGKTSSYIIPNLLSLDDCSIVATDPSGALSEKTAGDLEKRGFRVLILDPVHLDTSIGYNPLERAESFSAMQEVAKMLFNADTTGKSDPFWSQSAESIGGCLIACLKNHPEADKYANLPNLLYLLNNFGDGTPLMQFVATHAPDESVFLTFKAFISQADRTMQGILSQAKASIAWVADPDIARLTNRSTFDFESLRSEKIALFLRVPQNRVAYYAPLLSLMYTQLFHTLLDDDIFLKGTRKQGRNPKTNHKNMPFLPVHCLLDEFAHLTIPHFASIITTTRARHVSLSLVIQSVNQLNKRYGDDDAKVILNGGCASVLYFAGMDIDTAKRLKDTLGDVPVDTLLPNGQFRRDREPLMSSSAIRSMADNEAIYLYGNSRPMKLQLTPYYEQKGLVKRCNLPFRAVGGVQGGKVEWVGS